MTASKGHGEGEGAAEVRANQKSSHPQGEGGEAWRGRLAEEAPDDVEALDAVVRRIFASQVDPDPIKEIARLNAHIEGLRGTFDPMRAYYEKQWHRAEAAEARALALEQQRDGLAAKIIAMADQEDPGHKDDEWKHGYAAGLDDAAEIARAVLSSIQASPVVQGLGSVGSLETSSQVSPSPTVERTSETGRDMT